MCGQHRPDCTHGSLLVWSVGKDMVGALGAEVDRLETEVRELVPGLRHIDLETDRGSRAQSATEEPQLFQTTVPVNPLGQPS